MLSNRVPINRESNSESCNAINSLFLNYRKPLAFAKMSTDHIQNFCMLPYSQFESAVVTAIFVIVTESMDRLLSGQIHGINSSETHCPFVKNN